MGESPHRHSSSRREWEALRQEIRACEAREAVSLERERRLHTLLDGAPVVLSRHRADGTFLFVPAAARTLFGYKPDKLVGVSLFALVHEDDRDAVEQHVREANWKPGTVRHLSFRFRHRDGAYRWVEAHLWGVTVSDEQPEFAASIQDVSDRKQVEERQAAERDLHLNAMKKRLMLEIGVLEEAEAAVRRSVPEYLLTEEWVPPAIIAFDLNERVTRWNPTAERVFGYTREQALGRSLLELVVKEGLRSEPRPTWQDVLQARTFVRLTFENATADGSARQCDWYAMPMHDEEGRLVAVSAVVQDVTLQRTHEVTVKSYAKKLNEARELLELQVRQLSESIRQLEEAKWHAEHAHQAQSAFLAHLGHDFRTPLSAIIGFSEILTEEVTPDSREFPLLIRKSAERMMETFTALMDQARLEESEIELNLVPIDVCHEVAEIIGMFLPQATEKGLRLSHVLPDTGPVWVRLDWMPFNRVLMNLIGNAIKFTPEGAVTVTVRALDAVVEVEVRDTGIGIGEEFLPYMFDAFQQEERTVTFDGSGLGLAIARRLVTMMNGTIHVESRKGEGSTFTVRFPRLPADEAAGHERGSGGDGSAA